MRKEKKTWEIMLVKNTQKGGAWLLMCILKDELGHTEEAKTTAWSNASAGKRDAKVIINRKTIKWMPSGQDDKGKPTQFTARVDVRV